MSKGKTTKSNKKQEEKGAEGTKKKAETTRKEGEDEEKGEGKIK